jgi:hypothetical protein
LLLLIFTWYLEQRQRLAVAQALVPPSELPELPEL